MATSEDNAWPPPMVWTMGAVADRAKAADGNL